MMFGQTIAAGNPRKSRSRTVVKVFLVFTVIDLLLTIGLGVLLVYYPEARKVIPQVLHAVISMLPGPVPPEVQAILTQLESVLG
jgi:hypothetical protein